MAGPKLTKEKRSELRKEIGEQVASKIDIGAMVKTLATKYGIGENAIRWHHKKVVGGSVTPNAARAKRGRPKGSVTKRPVRKQRKSTRRGRPSSFKSLASALSKIAPADLRRAIKASKLQVKHDTLMAQAVHLRRQLKGTEKRARVLERRIARVVEG
jgi:hypothetical protein